MSQSSVRPLCELAARSICHGNRCLPDYLEELSGVRISTLCPSWQVSSKDSSGGKHGGPSGPSVGDTMVVSIPPPAPNRLPSIAPCSPGPSERPIREKATPIASTSAAVGRLESLRCQHLAAGLSERSSKLIRAGWSGGTNTTYQSGWKRWHSWCIKRKIDPFSCDIQSFLDFLASLYEEGLQHQSINTIRSAVSMTHRHIEGVPIGQHPLVTRLLKGVYNTRPPKRRYTETWDVDGVLNHLTSLGENSQLSRKQLSQKLVVLMALV